MNHTPYCDICERRCRLEEGRTGACGLYERRNGNIVERFPDRYLVTCPIAVETMPILHFRPGMKCLQVTTTGCNFNCPGCISTILVHELDPDGGALKTISVSQVADMAEEQGCAAIVFLMNDPLAAMPRFLRLAAEARARGLLVGCSSNAYFTPTALARLIPCLDFINIGMKGFTDAAYRACGAPEIAPVLRNLDDLHAAGVHVEVSCILTRDNADELRDLARHLAARSADIPL